MFLLDEVSLGSEDPRGGLLCPLEILCIAPGLASAVQDRWGSDSLPTNTSRLLETAAARLEDPLDRPKKVELGNCSSQL